MNVSPFGKLEVENTAEVRRIAALPRRVWSEQAGIDLAAMLTRELRRPGGSMSLRPVQAIALFEGMETRGLFGPIRVGGGKTLLLQLLALVLGAKNPVQLLPAALIEKTWHDYQALTPHWYLPTNLQMISYEMMGLVQHEAKLRYIKPDFIEADEAHYLKNRQAGRTRRVSRYMRENPETMFAAVSGTAMKGSIKDFTHLLRWCLKKNAPIPETEDEAAHWADAIDEKVNPLARRKPTGILSLGPAPQDVDRLTAARRVFQSRLLETKGVVASSKTDGVTCSLRISGLEYKPAPITEQHIANMLGLNDTPTTRARGEDKAWTTPDGWSFSEALELRRYIRELALGFHAIWDPRPPDPWRNARRDWAAFVRDILSHSRTLDTELQVTNAVDQGTLPRERYTPPPTLPEGWVSETIEENHESRGERGRAVLAAWRAQRDAAQPSTEQPFTINAKPVWHDDTALNTCLAWMQREKGIVWCEHVFFAKKLAQLSGAPYYGAEGLNERGESITHVKAGSAIIASVAANKAGRNLQMFDSNLITSCPSDALTTEQTLGRTHRDGQESDEVNVHILIGCKAHLEAFERARDGARAAADILGHDQKLLLADIVMPNVANHVGPLWV
jgi:hypothetical protein